MLEAIVCAHCGTEEDTNCPQQDCARCGSTLTRVEICSCHVFHGIETGKVFIGYYYVTNNPDCKVHG